MKKCRCEPSEWGEIQKIVSASIVREHADVTDGLVKMTGVAMSPDLRNAKIYVSILGGKVAGEKVIRLLNDRMHQIRGDVGRNMRLRYVPDLRFYLDDSSSHAARVAELLAKWHENERKGGDEQKESGAPDATDK